MTGSRDLGICLPCVPGAIPPSPWVVWNEARLVNSSQAESILDGLHRIANSGVLLASSRVGRSA